MPPLVRLALAGSRGAEGARYGLRRHAQHDVTERYRHVTGKVVAADVAVVNAYLARESVAEVAV